MRSKCHYCGKGIKSPFPMLLDDVDKHTNDCYHKKCLKELSDKQRAMQNKAKKD